MSDLSIYDDEKSLVEAADFALSFAKKNGATAAQTSASIGDGLSITARMKAVETLEHHRDQSLHITVYRGQSKGSASTNDLTPAAIQEATEAALNIARYTSEDEYAGLADAELMVKEFDDLDLYHPWDVNIKDATDTILACEAAGLEYDDRIFNSEGASISSHQGVSVFANTHGFMGTNRSSRHSLSCSMIAKNSDGMQRDYWYSTARQSDRLDTAKIIGEKAAERTVNRLSARSLTTRKTPVIFSPGQARSILSSVVSGLSGRSQYRQASFLLDAKGKKILPDFVNIYETPRLPGALGSSNYDNEGVATKSAHLIRDGVIERYVLGSYSARRLGLQTTANAGGVRNLTIDTGDMDLAGLMKHMGTGLYVTELIGHGVNIVNGDFSCGAAGFWIENGDIQYPVDEITVAGNLAEMYHHLIAVGNDVDYRGNLLTGSWLLEEMTIAGNS